MDYVKLAAEIALPDYSGMSDDEIIAALKAATVQGPFVDVKTSTIVGYLALNGLLFSLKLAAALPLSTTDKAKFTDEDNATVIAGNLMAVIGAVPVFESSNDQKRAAMLAMFGRLVKVGLASAEDAQVMASFAATTISKLASIDCSELQDMDDSCVLDHFEIARGNDPQLTRRTATADEIKMMDDHAAADLPADAPTQAMGTAARAALL